MATSVSDNPAMSRYELFVDGALAGFAAYEISADRLTVSHVEVDRQWSGRGLGAVLVDAVLTDVRLRGLSVLPVCPFTRKVISEDPAAYLDLVPADVRERFELPK